MNPITIKDNSFSIHPSGLSIADGLKYENWEQIGHCIVQGRSAMQWALGDWLNYGESNYGEMYSQAIDMTGYSENTLRTTKWVASRFQLSRRRDNLSFSHHREVAGLPAEQADSILDKAERDALPTTAVRELARAEQGLPEPEVRISEPTTTDAGIEAEETEQIADVDSEPIDVDLDAVGHVIPNERVRSMFARGREEIRPITHHIEQLRSSIKTYIDTNDPIFAHVGVANLRMYLNGVYREVKQAIPYAVCPYCTGDGCQKCARQGWLGKFAWEHVVPDTMKGSQ